MRSFRTLLLRVFLTAVFFVLLTPLSLALRVFRFDPLTLRAPRRATTFWMSRANNFAGQVRFTRVR